MDNYDFLNNVNFENYHKHTYDSNIFMTDSSVGLEDYAKRAIELGQKTLSSVEHGYNGRGGGLVAYEIAQEYNLKLIVGAEVYWVEDRFQNDKTNNHMIILAKNENGRQWLNEILSQANETGLFNGRPRIDWSLIELLPVDDVFITSACIGFAGYGLEYSKEYILKLHERFKDNFMIEMQYHNSDSQKKYNKFLLDIAKKHNIKLIMGCDSHMVSEDQAIDRDDLLASKNITYDDEGSWFMDYPDVITCYKRFEEQGVLTHDEILEAINNTNIVNTFEDFYFDKSSKMPNIYPDKTVKERNNLYIKLILDGWNKFKNTVSEEKYKEYSKAIKEEIDIVCGTNRADYFILNYEMINEGIKNGGIITPTARGSAGSFITNTLLGFSTLDRLNCDVKMYPERFMSKQRAGMPDIDFNLGNVEVFAEAQEKIMGKDHAYPMISFGTLKPKSALKMYARSQNLDVNIAQEISNQISKWEHDYNKAEDDMKEDIKLLDYIDEKYHKYIHESEKYLGIIMDKKKAPCSFILFSGSIRRMFGLIRCVSKTKTNGKVKDFICANVEGAVAERFGYIKNDLLKVDVHLLSKRVCERIGIPVPTSNEMIELTKDDKKTWDIYANGYTCLVNQCESEGTKAKAMRYKPTNYCELSAFVAAIRPSFKSNYANFEKRTPFSYGVKQLDDLLQTPQFPYSYVLYQEQIMNVLNYAGIPMGECYTIIKAISKKKVKVIRNVKEEFYYGNKEKYDSGEVDYYVEGFIQKLKESDNTITDERANTITDQVWTIIIDSSRYGFNSSHATAYAFDSLYGAYLKSHYPFEFYEVALQMYSEKGKKDKVSELIKEMKTAFNIDLGNFKFGIDNRAFNMDKGNNVIYPSILSIKNMNSKVAEELYNMKDINFNTFTDVLIYLLENTILTKTHINILIKINYFSQFGKNKKLDMIYEQFQKRYKKTHIDKTKEARKQELYEYENSLEDKPYTLKEQYKYEIELLGYPLTKLEKAPNNIYVISEYDDKYGIKIKCYNIHDGNTIKMTMYKTDYSLNPIGLGSIIKFDTYMVKKNGDFRLNNYEIL